MKAKLKSLAPWLVAIVLGVAVVGSVAKANSGFSWEVVMDKVADKLVQQVENLGQMIGASGTRYPNGISADTTSPVAGEVRGSTLTITGASTLSGTTTLGYTPNQLNVTTASFNSASTTMCSIQNTSGLDRVVTAFGLNVNAGTVAIGANSRWAAGITPARAQEGAPTATGTLFRNAFIMSSTLAVAYGGPVENSYYTSSTLNQIGGTGGISTTTPAMWYNGWYVNATTTAITSSTGNCKVLWYGF